MEMIDKEFDNKINIKKEIWRYISFWPIILFFLVFCIVLGFLKVRYTTPLFNTSAKIEILDKAQDSEMALPTSMTIFNRSMINIDNEVGRLKSYLINSEVCRKTLSNLKFYSEGTIRSTRKHKSEFFKDYSFDLKIDLDTIQSPLVYKLALSKSGLKVTGYNKLEEVISSHNFNSLSTYNQIHTLPFDIEVSDDDLFEESDVITKKILFDDFEDDVLSQISMLEFNNPSLNSGYNQASDQILIEIDYENRLIAEDYINTLISTFDSDGIFERQLEYKNTIQFVDSRSKFLEKELSLIENKKQNFKKLNKLTDLELNANYASTLIGTYDSELFLLRSQKELVYLLNNEINLNDYALLPINFGLEDQSINGLISQFNLLIKDRDRFLNSGAGNKNPLVLNISSQLDNLYNNIKLSIISYVKSLDLQIDSIIAKESELDIFYSEVPENEKILRSIERELEIKEALFLLLLQKKEEASVNFAVVKPTIKIIDNAMSSRDPVFPSKLNIMLFAAFSGILIPITLLFIWFSLDNKIHTKDDIAHLDLPLLAEIPYIESSKIKVIGEIAVSTRSNLIESIRMLLANLSYIIKKPSGNTILVTSLVKGEGKTLVSTHLSKIISFRNEKVLLVGTDLRNPQIHTYLGIDKYASAGLADYLYKYNIDWNDILVKNENLDIMLSGVIPPNPAELLNSEKYSNFLDEAKKKYDYIIVDSAPCLLVADTVQKAHLYDTTLCVVRANHSTLDTLKYLTDNKNLLSNLSLVLNSVGNSSKYGYKYGYQYGYKYGYNYGYGYGYSADE